MTRSENAEHRPINSLRSPHITGSHFSRDPLLASEVSTSDKFYFLPAALALRASASFAASTELHQNCQTRIRAESDTHHPPPPVAGLQLPLASFEPLVISPGQFSPLLSCLCRASAQRLEAPKKGQLTLGVKFGISLCSGFLVCRFSVDSSAASCVEEPFRLM